MGIGSALGVNRLVSGPVHRNPGSDPTASSPGRPAGACLGGPHFYIFRELRSTFPALYDSPHPFPDIDGGADAPLDGGLYPPGLLRSKPPDSRQRHVVQLSDDGMAAGPINQDGLALIRSGGSVYRLLRLGLPERLRQRSPGGGGLRVD